MNAMQLAALLLVLMPQAAAFEVVSVKPRASDCIREFQIQPGPSLFTVMQEQLGLKLQATRGPVDFFVIDSVERPTRN